MLSKGSKPLIERKNKKEILIGIKRRLNEEIGVIIELISKYNLDNFHTKGSIGYWNEFRLLFPIIETISKICNIDRQKLIKEELNIEVPTIFWNAYRNSLMHNDWPYISKLKDRIIPWGVTLDGGDHYISKEDMIIDPGVLYRSIDKFLEKIINETDNNEIIKIDIGIEYFPDGLKDKRGKIIKPSQEIIKEFNFLEEKND